MFFIVGIICDVSLLASSVSKIDRINRNVIVLFIPNRKTIVIAIKTISRLHKLHMSMRGGKHKKVCHKQRKFLIELITVSIIENTLTFLTLKGIDVVRSYLTKKMQEWRRFLLQREG